MPSFPDVTSSSGGFQFSYLQVPNREAGGPSHDEGRGAGCRWRVGQIVRVFPGRSHGNLERKTSSRGRPSSCDERWSAQLHTAESTNFPTASQQSRPCAGFRAMVAVLTSAHVDDTLPAE